VASATRHFATSAKEPDREVCETAFRDECKEMVPPQKRRIPTCLEARKYGLPVTGDKTAQAA
jgi:hypothetical protein